MLFKRDLSGLASPYFSLFLESQVLSSAVMAKTLNPTWANPNSVFEVSSSRKFLHCLVWDHGVVGDPACMGEIRYGLSMILVFPFLTR